MLISRSKNILRPQQVRFTRVTLTGFKNYTARSFAFTERIVGICGLNGKGKTNLLDALNYLCFTRSYFSRSDQLNVHFGEAGFRLEGNLQNGRGETDQITCVYRPNVKKDFLLNEIPYERFSQHIGKFPSVFIAPDDVALITGGSEERRKYLDTMISQMDDTYLDHLIRYNKLLAERNALLKLEFQRRRKDDTVLQAIDERMIPSGTFIHESRKKFTETLFVHIQKFYDLIAGAAERIGMEYESPLCEMPFRELLQFSLDKDRYLQRTTSGIHKDDIEFRLKANPFRQIASQGQRKSLLFACKLAEFEMLKQEKGYSPILLLDDVFEKLDERRIGNLLQYICEENEAQVFITDTDAARLKRTLARFDAAVQVIDLT